MSRLASTMRIDLSGVCMFTRTLILTLSVGLILVSEGLASEQGQQGPSADFLLEVGRAGPIELGTEVEQLFEFYGRENVRLVDLFKEGYFSPALEVRLPGALVVPGAVIAIREGPCAGYSVWDIEVRDPRFRTKDGFGVGSTAGDLRRSYSFQITEEEGAHAAVVDALKMSFFLTREGPVDQQRVTAVGIWADPDAVRQKRCP